MKYAFTAAALVTMAVGSIAVGHGHGHANAHERLHAREAEPEAVAE